MINDDTSSKTVILIPVLVFILSGFTTFKTTAPSPRQQKTEDIKPDSLPSYRNLKRMVPNPIDNEIPSGYKQSVARHMRTPSGEPGPGYWQQESDYDIDVRILPEQKKLIGQSTITYHNNSPDTLRNIYLALTLNVDKKGAIRNLPQNISGGFNIKSFSYDGTALAPVRSRNKAGYQINGTVMKVVPPHPLPPGQTVTMKTSYNFNIPRSGAGTGRIGYDDDNLFFIAYWYPKVRVYDDVAGWSTDPFLGIAQFYNEFGHYNVHVTVPPQWIVAATGQLTNAEEVLSKPVYQRMVKAHRSDSVVHVVRKEDFGHVTKKGNNGELTWNFTANKVNDFVFSLTKSSMWDATRTPVGDRDGDGTTDYTNIDAFYRSSAPLWKHAARFEQDAIKHHSNFTGLSYPWPHMTAVEAGDIRGGGMEYPMMTLISPNKGGSTRGLYSVIAHELGHEWDPMQLATNERRYGWMDESTATFLESQAAKDFYNTDQVQVHKSLFNGYLRVTRTDQEGPIMRWSDYQYSGLAHGVASYAKPASMLIALRGLLGEKTFNEAYHTFMRHWQYKHPYPWDFFRTIEDVSGRNLDWFWRSWYYESWTLDQAVAKVEQTSNGARITIQDKGQIPMPATVQVTLANGQTLDRHIDVDTWLQGAIQKVLHIDADSPVTKVVIDPNYKYPDANRSNNRWEKDS